MGHGTRSYANLKTGAISEAVREEETLRYGAALLADSVINDTGIALDPSRLCASSDGALAAFAQLGALRLNAERVLISLFDRKRQHIIAEAKQSTAIEFGPDDDSVPEAVGAPLLLAGTAIPREHGVCERVLDRPAQECEGGSLLPVEVVPDLSQDGRISSKPYFGPSSPFRFFAGVPLRTTHGIDIGVLCIFDSEPRDSLGTPSQRFLRHLSGLVMGHLQARVSTASYRRNERMVRGLGSMVEGMGSMAKHRNAPNPASFEDARGKGGVLEEGALNVKQQRLQGQASPRPSLQPVQPSASLSQSMDNSKSLDVEGHQNSSTDTLESGVDRPESETASLNIPEEEDDENMAILKSLFSRAANIIRESVEVEGALFLDASVGSYGGLVPQADEEAEAEKQNRSPGSSGEESLATDESTYKPVLCKVLGFSDSDCSSINGDTARSELSSVPDTFIERLSHRYAEGQIINFGDDGQVVWAISDSEGSETTLSPSSGGDELDRALKKRIRERPRKSDGEFLRRMFPGARSVALIPLLDAHKERWFAAGFVWTKSRARVFMPGELSYLKAFGSAAMAEVRRMDVLRENKAKEDVLGSLSHEIRSPLHGVVLGVELLHDSVLTGLQEDVLHTVETCGRTLLDTLDHLLDFSKVNHFLQKPRRKAVGKARGLGVDSSGHSSIQAGMMSIFSEVRLDMLLEEVIESVYAGFSFQDMSSQWATRERSGTSYFKQAGTLRRLESVRRMDTVKPFPEGTRPKVGVSVHLNIDSTVPWTFHAQPGALRRIIMNIFGNALKYTARGHILVSLTQEPFSSKKRSRRRTIILSISDSGGGISSDYLQNRLFTPFAQENQLSAGAGLGLSLVKQIIHGLGGRISVESQVGHGTTIRVLIPLRLSSPRTSPTTVDRQLSIDFTKLLEQLEGVSVTLLGFPDDFGEHQPLIVETGDTQSSPKASLELLCHRFMHLKLIPLSEVPSTPPSLFICAEHALDQIAILNGHARSTPTVVVCDSHLSSHQHTVKFSSPGYPLIRECVSQPIGPRKLARLLVFALERAKNSPAQASGQVSLPMSNTGAAQEASQPPENSASSSGLPPSFPESKHADGAVLPALPHRPVEPPPDALEPAPVALEPPPVALESSKTGEPTTAGAAQGDTITSAEPTQEHEMPSPSTQEEHIPFLLVDDNAINLKMLGSYMKKLGRGYDCASNGLEALEGCRARTVNNYRCIFMDISMPVMDGLESTRLIRAHERQHQQSPALIIALTGLASAKTQQEAFGSGVDLFLSKPVSLKELGHILEARGL